MAAFDPLSGSDEDSDEEDAESDSDSSPSLDDKNCVLECASSSKGVLI